MDFAHYARLVDGLYSTLLESGGQDAVALTEGIEAAYQAMEHLPPALAAKLTPSQEREWSNLGHIYHNLAQNPGWQPEDQRGWLEDARALLLAVQR